MRILLAAKHPPAGALPIGGVQSWCATVGRTLKLLGHQVTHWGPEWPLPAWRFDVGIVANVPFTRPAMDLCSRVLVVSHGIIEAERPEGDLIAFTSEGVRAHWGMEGPVIRQPIDLDFWSPSEGRRRYLTRFSYRGGLRYLPRVAHRLGLEFQHVAQLHPFDARAILRDSACVLATGRAALEAMACGVPVVICDHRRTYQGPLLDPDTLGAMERNYSGRGGIAPTLESVEGAVRAAMQVGSLRHHVQAHHDASAVTAQLLELVGC